MLHQTLQIAPEPHFFGLLEPEPHEEKNEEPEPLEKNEEPEPLEKKEAGAGKKLAGSPALIRMVENVRFLRLP